FLLHRLDHRLFAVQTADPRAGAALAHPDTSGIVAVDLVEFPYRAILRITRVTAAHPGRVRGHAPDLAFHFPRLLAQTDEIAVGLGHFLTVQARHARSRGQ